MPNMPLRLWVWVFFFIIFYFQILQSIRKRSNSLSLSLSLDLLIGCHSLSLSHILVGLHQLKSPSAHLYLHVLLWQLLSFLSTSYIPHASSCLKAFLCLHQHFISLLYSNTIFRFCSLSIFSNTGQIPRYPFSSFLSLRNRKKNGSGPEGGQGSWE